MRQVINRILELFAEAYFKQWGQNKDSNKLGHLVRQHTSRSLLYRNTSGGEVAAGDGICSRR